MNKIALSALTMAYLSTSAFAEMSLKFNGDLRYRNETISYIESGSKKETSRDRIRARLKATGNVTESIKATLRLATGGQSITSTNETLNDAGANDDLDLDLAYVDWTAASWANIYAGKMKNVFYRPGKSDLMFDGDWTPEGLAASLNRKYGMLGIDTNLAYYRMSQANNTTNVNLFAPQIALTLDLPVKLTFGAGYYAYNSIIDSSPASSKGKNSTNAGGNYAEDFKVMQLFAEVKGSISKIKYSLFADYVKNNEVSSANKEDNAYLMGASLKCDKWKLKYDYRWSEADAFVGAISDGDSCGGGTQCKGHRVSLGYKFHKNVSGKVTYYGMEDRSSQTHYDKLHLDAVFKF